MAEACPGHKQFLVNLLRLDNTTPVAGTVLITGASGYIGGRLVRILSELPGLHVRLGIHPSVSLPSWMEGMEAVPLNVLSDADIGSACGGVTYVVHLAALSHGDCEADPEQALIVNSLGTLKLLSAARSAGAERFLYFSTAHVYGTPLVGTFTEKILPRPANPYAITHRAAEDFVLAAGRIRGVVLRLSNGFGAPAHPEISQWSLIGNDLCRQAVTSRRMVLRTSGLQRRDLVPLSDVGLAVAHFLALPDSLCGDGLFNLGGDCSIRIIDLAEHIAARCQLVLGFVPQIIRPDPTPGEVSQPLDYRIDKLKATGFTPRGNIEEEIDAALRLCWRVFREAS